MDNLLVLGALWLLAMVCLDKACEMLELGEER